MVHGFSCQPWRAPPGEGAAIRGGWQFVATDNTTYRGGELPNATFGETV